jgi:rhodanese-related sulfurtransferase
VLVDARPANEYRGEDEVWLRKGHIPGAVSFHWARVMAADNTHQFKKPEEVRADLAAAGVTPDKDVIVYCGTSREGSLLRFYLRHVMNYPRVRLYEGSWKEYAHLKQYPAEQGSPAGQPAGGRSGEGEAELTAAELRRAGGRSWRSRDGHRRRVGSGASSIRQHPKSSTSSDGPPPGLANRAARA